MLICLLRRKASRQFLLALPAADRTIASNRQKCPVQALLASRVTPLNPAGVGNSDVGFGPRTRNVQIEMLICFAYAS